MVDKPVTSEKRPMKHRKLWIFILKTVVYFVILFILMYLYSYTGVDGGHFIYNEF